MALCTVVHLKSLNIMLYIINLQERLTVCSVFQIYLAMAHACVFVFVCVCLCFFSIFFKMKKIYTILKVTFHLQLLQNTGYIPCVVQYILVTYLFYTQQFVPQSPSLMLPLSPLVTTSLYSIYGSLFHFYYNHSVFYF